MSEQRQKRVASRIIGAVKKDSVHASSNGDHSRWDWAGGKSVSRLVSRAMSRSVRRSMSR